LERVLHFLSRLASDHDPISVSCVARITGVKHHTRLVLGFLFAKIYTPFHPYFQCDAISVPSLVIFDGGPQFWE
jgi:hypothetical protein